MIWEEHRTEKKRRPQRIAKLVLKEVGQALGSQTDVHLLFILACQRKLATGAPLCRMTLCIWLLQIGGSLLVEG